MNAGQRLVELSRLSGISAGAHFLSITQSTGATVFASTFTVLIDEPVLHVGIPTKEVKSARQVAEVDTKPGKELKRLFIETTPAELIVNTCANTLTVVEVKA